MMQAARDRNLPKITQAVFLVLRRYHHRYGLCVLPWYQQPGNAYFSFYSTAV
jgi:hypothetical protein